MAEIAYVAATFDNPLYAEEMNILDFLKQPDVTIFQALLLKFKPVNMDVLPLYIVLLLLFPPVLCLCSGSRPGACRIGGALCRRLEFRLESAGLSERRLVLQSVRLATAVRVRRLVRDGRCAAAWRRVALAHHLGARARLLGVCFRDHVDLAFRTARRFVPTWLGDWMYPIDKTNLDVMRFAHFLALATVTVRFVPRDWPGLRSPILQPAIRLRPAFAGDLLPRRVSGVRRAFPVSPNFRRAANASASSALPESRLWLPRPR